MKGYIDFDTVLVTVLSVTFVMGVFYTFGSGMFTNNWSIDIEDYDSIILIENNTEELASCMKSLDTSDSEFKEFKDNIVEEKKRIGMELGIGNLLIGLASGIIFIGIVIIANEELSKYKIIKKEKEVKKK